MKQILVRTSGYLRGVASHSLQPYRGCALGNSLCGVGCYVRHNAYVTRGQAWGSFVDIRANAAAAYRGQYQAERRWLGRQGGRGERGEQGGRGQPMVIFLSSSTEPFQPIERRAGITRAVLEAMVDQPPDGLIIQTHSPRVVDYLPLYERLARVTSLRFHISIETDLPRLPGLPPPASSPEARLSAAATLKAAGHRTVVTVSPLLPIAEPERFFDRISQVAHAVVLDHFVGGDGSPTGSRTARTSLPQAMQAVLPRSVSRAYLQEMVEMAQRVMPGRVGVNIDGFAGRMLPATEPIDSAATS